MRSKAACPAAGTLALVLLLASTLFWTPGCRQQKQDPCSSHEQNMIPPECAEGFAEQKDLPSEAPGVILSRYVFNELDEYLFGPGDTTLPVVAIHVSEDSRKEWDFNIEFYLKGIEYFEAYTALEEILDSHKIPFVELGDRQVENGELLTGSGAIRYPILFSFNNEVITEKGADQLKDYVSRGGTVFFTYDSFTRLKKEGAGDGSSGLESPEGCFVMPELGLECLHPPDRNRIYSDAIEKERDHPIVRHIPGGELAWRMCLYRITPFHSFLVRSREEDNVLVTGRILHRKWSFKDILNGASSVVTYKYNETETVNTAVIGYGNGSFIYNSQVNLLWGRYQGEPAIHGALIALDSIRWAFERSGTPMVEMKPWGEYDAAFMQRFDVEVDKPAFIAVFMDMLEVLDRHKEKGVFYIVADQEQKGADEEGFRFVRITDPDISYIITSAARKGHVIASHSTWHIGPDFEPEDQAARNINGSLEMFRQVLGHRPDEWTSPAFGANFDSSLQLVEKLGIRTTGDQKIGYLPHFSLSPETEGLHYDVLQIPTSDFFHPDYEDGTAPATILEHHSRESIGELVDFYYELGGIINLYSHFKEGNDKRLDQLLEAVSRKENVWHTTPDELYAYWKEREAIDYTGVSVMGNRMMVGIANMNKRDSTTYVRITPPPGERVSYIEAEEGYVSGFEMSGDFVDIGVEIGAGEKTVLIVGFLPVKG